jgi:hypothetical protein
MRITIIFTEFLTALNASMGVQSIQILFVSSTSTRYSISKEHKWCILPTKQHKCAATSGFGYHKMFKLYYRKYLVQKSVLRGIWKVWQVKNQNISQQCLGNQSHTPQLKTVFVSAATGAYKEADLDSTEEADPFHWAWCSEKMLTSVHTQLLTLSLLCAAF